jgi:hypothetical protein
MQHVIAMSYDTRPLTPISGRLAVCLPEEHHTNKADIFAQDLLSNTCHHYKGVLLAHAHLYKFAGFARSIAAKVDSGLNTN